MKSFDHLNHEWERLNDDPINDEDEHNRQQRRIEYADMHTVGYKSRGYDFCSIDCLVNALRADQSI